MLTALLLSHAALAASPSACEQVRAVRQMAQAGALDTATLDILEGRMCDATAASQAQRCNQLITLHWLGFTDDIPTEELAQVQTATEAVCEHDAPSPPTWANGVSAFSADGTIHYPSGSPARAPDGSWLWPSGVAAHRADGAWQYPSGVAALLPDGTFQKPDGLRVADAQSLVAWGCEGNPRACDLLLPKIGVLEGEAEVAAIISLAWFASPH